MTTPKHTHLPGWIGPWLDLLAEIVNTDSAPDDHSGIDAVYAKLVPPAERLGFTIKRLPTDGGPDVLRAHRSSTHRATKRVLLVGHVDTVFAAGTARARPFTVDGEHAFGPGVADMKGGLVVALAALSRLRTDALDRLDVTLLFNADEESGSPHSRPLIEAEALDRDLVLVFESARRTGAIVSSRRGVGRYRIDVTGRAAHSGTNPGNGANALETLAHKIVGVQELGRGIEGASVTAVLASGGTRPNIVPETASLHVDSRFDDISAEQAVDEGLRALAGPGPVAGTSTTVSRYGGRPPFQKPATDLAESYVAAARDLGVSISTTATGGSSDANITAALGIPTLDGLGPVGGGAHTAEEYVELATVAERAEVCANFLRRLAEQGSGER